MKSPILNIFEYNFTGRRDMTECYLVAQDISNLDLSKAILDRAELDCAIVNNANLTETSLKGTSFFSADLEGVNLAHAHVEDCDFRHANLENADLTGVDFSTSDVKDAVFTDAQGLSLEQKIWLRNHGALNVSLDDEQYENIEHDGLLNKLKLWLSFSH